MTDRELIDRIKCACENANSDLADRILAIVTEHLETSMTIETQQLVKMIDNVSHRLLTDHFQKSIANEIGNRLRCGCYNGTDVDKLFESVWTNELDRAIKDRIESKVYKAIDTVIAERLRQMKS